MIKVNDTVVIKPSMSFLSAFAVGRVLRITGRDALVQWNVEVDPDSDQPNQYLHRTVTLTHAPVPQSKPAAYRSASDIDIDLRAYHKGTLSDPSQLVAALAATGQSDMLDRATYTARRR